MKRDDDVYKWWPISIHFSLTRHATMFFAWHGWQVGWVTPAVCGSPRIFGQTYHAVWGRIRISFGRIIR